LKSWFSIFSGTCAKSLLAQRLDRGNAFGHRARKPIRKIGGGLIALLHFGDGTLHGPDCGLARANSQD
jgi:hypothetical protein